MATCPKEAGLEGSGDSLVSCWEVAVIKGEGGTSEVAGKSQLMAFVDLPPKNLLPAFNQSDFLSTLTHGVSKPKQRFNMIPGIDARRITLENSSARALLTVHSIRLHLQSHWLIH